MSPFFALDELNDQEATNQSEATRLAAQEIQKLVEEKETLARFLQEQVYCAVFVYCFQLYYVQICLDVCE